MADHSNINTLLRNRINVRCELNAETQQAEQNAAVNDWLRAQNHIVPRNVETALRARINKEDTNHEKP